MLSKLFSSDLLYVRKGYCIQMRPMTLSNSQPNCYPKTNHVCLLSFSIILTSLFLLLLENGLSKKTFECMTVMRTFLLEERESLHFALILSLIQMPLIRRLSKTLWQKKTLLIMSNLSFCHTDFYSIQ